MSKFSMYPEGIQRRSTISSDDTVFVGHSDEHNVLRSEHEGENFMLVTEGQLLVASVKKSLSWNVLETVRQTFFHHEASLTMDHARELADHALSPLMWNPKVVEVSEEAWSDVVVHGQGTLLQRFDMYHSTLAHIEEP